MAFSGWDPQAERRPFVFPGLPTSGGWLHWLPLKKLTWGQEETGAGTLPFPMRVQGCLTGAGAVLRPGSGLS